jgi:hypothetical protein
MLETNQQFYFEIPCERTNHNFEDSSRHRIIQQGSRFSFRLSLLPLHPPPPLLPHIASRELLISTNLRNHLHFITSIFYHPWRAFPRPPPQCILLPNTIPSPIRSLACVCSRRCLIPSRFLTVILIYKCISWSVISFASWNKGL